MHEAPVKLALSIGDILDSIFDQLPQPRVGRVLDKDFNCVMHDTGHFANLSRVCKIFSDFALNRLWDTLYDFKILLRLLSVFSRTTHTGIRCERLPVYVSVVLISLKY